MENRKWLMDCGHASNTMIDGHPWCVICGCNIIHHEVQSPTDGLEGRKASCTACNNIRESKWTLAFFEYRPKALTDSYYCGCRGWD